MKRAIYLSLLALLFVGACKKEQPFSRFSSDVLLPLAHAELNLKNLLRDSTLVPDPNGALRLVNAYDLYRANIQDLFMVPDSENVNTLSLNTLELADQSQAQAVPLFLVFPAASSLDGQTVPIPAQSISGVGAIDIDGSNFFQEATFRSGTLEVKIDNGYPVEISKLIFQLSNKVDGSIIQTDTFTNILPGASQTKVVDLSGKTLYAAMQATPILFETAASNGPVKINQFAITTITFSVKDMKPESAIARFPAQTVLSSDDVIVYDLGEVQLKRMTVKEGTARFRVVSTIEEDMKIEYSIPYATLNGQAFHKFFTVPAAPPGGVSNFKIEYDLKDYDIDTRGKNPTVTDTVNTLYNVLKVSIDSSGIERQISLNDSVFLYAGLVDMKPSYAEGYFGNQVFEGGPETVDLDLLGPIQGNLDFEDLNVNIVLENGLGIPGEAAIKQLTSRNTYKGNAIALSGAVVNNVHSIAPAAKAPFVPSITVLNLNTSNSNIKPFIEQLPNKLDYDFSITTSPNGNINNFKDFVTDQSELAVRLEVDMPVSLKADGLTLSDTFNFNLEGVNNFDRILSGKLNVVVDNGFPLEMELQVFLLDGNGLMLDSLVGTNQNLIQAGKADVNNRVVQSLRSVVVANVPAEKMSILKEARKVMVRARLNTPKSNTNYWKLYSDYTLNISLTGDFIYDQSY
ncbi:MAG: hypothetical protein GC180_10945 [Bacteroidetes bacterium]|nr:hypothetical protein [Bacteroidota bacterium]